jgi:hypothetical protein
MQVRFRQFAVLRRHEIELENVKQLMKLHHWIREANDRTKLGNRRVAADRSGLSRLAQANRVAPWPLIACVLLNFAIHGLTEADSYQTEFPLQLAALLMAPGCLFQGRFLLSK